MNSNSFLYLALVKLSVHGMPQRLYRLIVIPGTRRMSLINPGSVTRIWLNQYFLSAVPKGPPTPVPMSDPRQYAEINRSLLVLIPKVEQPVSIKMAIILLLFVLDTGLVLSALSVFSAGPNNGIGPGISTKIPRHLILLLLVIS